MKHLLIASFCDGSSTAQYVLNKITKGKEVELDYHAFELDPKAVLLTSTRFPDTHQHGDIRNWRKGGKIFKRRPDLFCAGTSCKNTSNAGDRTGFSTLSGKKVKTLEQYIMYDRIGVPMNESCICFWESIWFMRTMKPKYTFFEIPLLSKEFLDIFIKETGLEYIKIDSALVSAQSRKRYYFTNIPGLCQPKDKGIMLEDIIPGAASYSKHGALNPKFGKPGQAKWGVSRISIRKDGKHDTLTTKRPKVIQGGVIRLITPEEAEMLMGFKPCHTQVLGLSDTDRFRILGNGWSVPTIVHIFKGLLKTELFKYPKLNLEYSK
jgi:DNA (cytosine-5)-methyltransferase 3A